jgi:hypothetical protein
MASLLEQPSKHQIAVVNSVLQSAPPAFVESTYVCMRARMDRDEDDMSLSSNSDEQSDGKDVLVAFADCDHQGHNKSQHSNTCKIEQDQWQYSGLELVGAITLEDNKQANTIRTALLWPKANQPRKADAHRLVRQFKLSGDGDDRTTGGPPLMNSVGTQVHSDSSGDSQGLASGGATKGRDSEKAMMTSSSSVGPMSTQIVALLPNRSSHHSCIRGFDMKEVNEIIHVPAFGADQVSIYQDCREGAPVPINRWRTADEKDGGDDARTTLGFSSIAQQTNATGLHSAGMLPQDEARPTPPSSPSHNYNGAWTFESSDDNNSSSNDCYNNGVERKASKYKEFKHLQAKLLHRSMMVAALKPDARKSMLNETWAHKKRPDGPVDDTPGGCDRGASSGDSMIGRHEGHYQSEAQRQHYATRNIGASAAKRRPITAKATAKVVYAVEYPTFVWKPTAAAAIEITTPRGCTSHTKAETPNTAVCNLEPAGGSDRGASSEGGMIGRQGQYQSEAQRQHYATRNIGASTAKRRPITAKVTAKVVYAVEYPTFVWKPTAGAAIEITMPRGCTSHTKAETPNTVVCNLEPASSPHGSGLREHFAARAAGGVTTSINGSPYSFGSIHEGIFNDSYLNDDSSDEDHESPYYGDGVSLFTLDSLLSESSISNRNDREETKVDGDGEKRFTAGMGSNIGARRDGPKVRQQASISPVVVRLTSGIGQQATITAPGQQEPQPAAKRKRGRPRKQQPVCAATLAHTSEGLKNKRARPRKQRPELASAKRPRGRPRKQGLDIDSVTLAQESKDSKKKCRRPRKQPPIASTSEVSRGRAGRKGAVKAIARQQVIRSRNSGKRKRVSQAVHDNIAPDGESWREGKTPSKRTRGRPRKSTPKRLPVIDAQARPKTTRSSVQQAPSQRRYLPTAVAAEETKELCGNLKNGASLTGWSSEENAALKSQIEKCGVGSVAAIMQHPLLSKFKYTQIKWRAAKVAPCGKSCLSKSAVWSRSEEKTLARQIKEHGNRWTTIKQHDVLSRFTHVQLKTRARRLPEYKTLLSKMKKTGQRRVGRDADAKKLAIIGGAGIDIVHKWTPFEEETLVEEIKKHGTHWKHIMLNPVFSRFSYSSLSGKGAILKHKLGCNTTRSLNYHGWSAVEEQALAKELKKHGNKWSLIMKNPLLSKFTYRQMQDKGRIMPEYVSQKYPSREPWTKEDLDILEREIRIHGRNRKEIAKALPLRSAKAVFSKIQKVNSITG